MHTVQVLNHLIQDNQVLAYILIFLGLIFEGEIVVITTGVLSYLGVLNFWISLSFILAGGMAKTFGGYYLGGFLYKKYSHHSFFRYLEKRVLFFMPRFEKKPFWSIFISKFIMINHFVIVFAGYQKINFKKYLKAELLSTVIWAPGLILLGYFFSYTAISVSHEIWRFLMIVLVLIIAFVLFDKLVSRIYEIFEEFYHNHS